MPISRSPIAVPLCLAALAACGGAEGGGAAHTSRDSAGVTIVESERAAWREGAGWRVEDEPSVDIGLTEGEAAYQLDRVRDAVRLSDGRIAVANGGTSEIRFFDAGGRYLSATGREGEGPGEFKALSRLIRLPGDTLLAYDQMTTRLTWLDAQGKLLASTQVGDGLGSPLRFAQRLGDGSLLLTRSERRLGASFAGGLTRDTVTFLRATAGTDQRDSLFTAPGRESVVEIRGMNVNVARLPHLREALTAPASDGFYLGINDTYRIEHRRADGSLKRVFLRAQQPQPVEGEYLDSLRRVRERESGAQSARNLGDMPGPVTLPAFSELLVDDEGNVWVRTFPWPGEETSRWDVFKSDGQLLGTVTFPPRFRPTHIGRNFVLGGWTDDLDVEHVRMYPLSKE